MKYGELSVDPVLVSTSDRRTHPSIFENREIVNEHRLLKLCTSNNDKKILMDMNTNKSANI